jgi:hypothetical protein
MPGDPVLSPLLWTSSLRRADRSDMVSFCMDSSYLRNRDLVLHRSIGARYPDLAFDFVSYMDGTRSVRAGVGYLRHDQSSDGPLPDCAR